MDSTLGNRSRPVCQARDESTVNLVTQPRTARGEAATWSAVDGAGRGESRERDSSSVTPANDRRARHSYRQGQTIHEKEEWHGREEVPLPGASGHLSMLVQERAFRLPSQSVRGNVVPDQALGELLG